MSPVQMTEEQLAQYGLTTADRTRMLEWDTEDVAPVADILVKWIKAGIEPPELLDAVYTFFQHCYHLKDWVKNDPSSPHRATVENFVSQSSHLSICADICNGSKHLTLTSRRSRAEPHVQGVGQVRVSQQVVTVQSVVIDHAGAKLNAFDLAQSCMSEWQLFLK